MDMTKEYTEQSWSQPSYVGFGVYPSIFLYLYIMINSIIA